MRNIAFKRAKHCPNVAQSLHPEYIVEYAYTDLFEEGFHKIEDGYEILSEIEFNKEFKKNTQYQLEHSDKKKFLRQSESRAKQAKLQKKRQEIKEELRKQHKNLKKGKK